MTLHSYWTSKCAECPLKTRCTTGKERRIKRWEHEVVIDAMQDRLDRAPKSMRVRRATVEHPFGTLKAWMGATHFKTRTLEKVRTEMSLHVLAYNLSGLQSEACDRHPGCPVPDGGHARLRPRLKRSCFSARPSKSDNRKPPAGQPSADHASAFLHSLHPLLKFKLPIFFPAAP